MHKFTNSCCNGSIKSLHRNQKIFIFIAFSTVLSFFLHFLYFSLNINHSTLQKNKFLLNSYKSDISHDFLKILKFTNKTKRNIFKNFDSKLISALPSEKGRKFAIGGNERLFKERLDNSAAYASLAYCLKNKDGDEVAPGVFAKSIIARNEQNGNDLVIYFSGINPTREEWLDKIFTLGNYEPFSSIIKVDRNFWNSFSNMTILKEKIVKTLQGTSNKQIDTVRFIGHSLGGVYAMFAAATLHNTQGNDRVEVFTFGQPPIGNYEFAKWFNSLSKKNLIAFRVTHSDDIIPRLPIDKPKVPLFHHAVEVWIDANCDCYQNEQVYVCHGPIENGFYTESDQCNKGSKTMGGHAHNGPYFGHYMGVCPFLQFENDQIYLENLNNIFMQ